MKNVVVLGDSIAQGEKADDGWTHRLRKHVKQRGQGFVYNLGISGDTSREVLDRFEEEVSRRKIEDEESELIIIFQVGINDSLHIFDSKNNQVSIEEFQQNIEKLILRSQKMADHVFFLGLTPVIEKQVNPLPWDDRKAYRYRDIRSYEDALFEICNRYNQNFIELYDQFPEDYSGYLEDGIHPNDKGHQLIFEVVKDRLRDEQIT